MPVPRYSYMIGAGWGLPLGSLTNVELIKPPNDPYLYPPASYGSYDPGLAYAQLDGVTSYRGFPSVSWDWRGQPGGWMTYGQAEYLRTQFFNGSLSAKVTVYTKTATHNVYERYNAIATITKLPESGANFKVLNRFQVRLSHLVAL